MIKDAKESLNMTYQDKNYSRINTLSLRGSISGLMMRYNCRIDLEAIITLFCLEVRYSTSSRSNSAFITSGHLAQISLIEFNLIRKEREYYIKMQMRMKCK